MLANTSRYSNIVEFVYFLFYIGSKQSWNLNSYTLNYPSTTTQISSIIIVLVVVQVRSSSSQSFNTSLFFMLHHRQALYSAILAYIYTC